MIKCMKVKDKQYEPLDQKDPCESVVKLYHMTHLNVLHKELAHIYLTFLKIQTQHELGVQQALCVEVWGAMLL